MAQYQLSTNVQTNFTSYNRYAATVPSWAFTNISIGAVGRTTYTPTRAARRTRDIAISAEEQRRSSDREQPTERRTAAEILAVIENSQRRRRKRKRGVIYPGPISAVNQRANSVQYITVRPGRNVTLPCRAPSNAKIVAVEWTRLDLESEGYVFLIRDGHLDTTNQHPSFENRVELKKNQLDDGDLSLVLKDVSINDTGTYECRYKDEEARVRKRAAINSEPVSIIKLNVDPVQYITVHPGHNVTLPCRAPSNAKIVAVEWTRLDLESEGYVFLIRDGHLDTTNQHPSFENRVELKKNQLDDGDLSLVLKNVSINDTGIYECRYKDEEEKVMKRAAITTEPVSIIKLNVDPVQYITVRPGFNVTLPCRAPSNAKIVAVEWTRLDLESEGYVFLIRDGHLDTTNQHPSFENRVELKKNQLDDGDLSLVLKDVSINDIGAYECRCKDEEARVRKRAAITTEPVSIIKLNVESVQYITVRPGRNVTLPCRAPSNSKIVAVEWTRLDLESEGYVFLIRDGLPDTTNQHPSFENRVELKKNQLDDGDLSLVLKKAKINDTGIYECRYKDKEARVRKRAAIKQEPVSIIKLNVTDPDLAAGNTWTEGQPNRHFGLVAAGVFLSFGLCICLFLLI